MVVLDSRHSAGSPDGALAESGGRLLRHNNAPDSAGASSGLRLLRLVRWHECNGVGFHTCLFRSKLAAIVTENVVL